MTVWFAGWNPIFNKYCTYIVKILKLMVDCVWNVMAHAQKPYFVFRWNGRVHLNRRGRQFSRLLAAEVCASAVVMLDTPCSEVVWRVLVTNSIRQFPPSLPLSCVTVCYHVSTGVYLFASSAGQTIKLMYSRPYKMSETGDVDDEVTANFINRFIIWSQGSPVVFISIN